MKFAPLLAAAILVGLAAPALAQTKTDTWSNSFTLEGEAKYGPDYTHFDYVNVDAPKGGTIRMGELGGFDTFNPILPKGEVAGGIGLLYETLLTPSLDEQNTYYGLLAEALKIAPDYGAVTFRMDPDAPPSGTMASRSPPRTWSGPSTSSSRSIPIASNTTSTSPRSPSPRPAK